MLICTNGALNENNNDDDEIELGDSFRQAARSFCY